jgi:two-component system, OmpR family, response regulator QseB
MRILLVEDDRILGDAIQNTLAAALFAVDWCREGRQADTALHTTDYDIVLLDLGLPGMDGLELLKRLRARHHDLPVLILTARDTVPDRVSGLDAGADDYMVKPFDMTELTARVRALLRRAHARTTPLIAYRDILIDPATRCVTRNNQSVELSAKEYAVLVELLEHRGMPLSREQLEESLYGWNEEIESNAIEVHIHHLRKKLGAELIKTMRGVGYVIGKA